MPLNPNKDEDFLKFSSGLSSAFDEADPAIDDDFVEVVDALDAPWGELPQPDQEKRFSAVKAALLALLLSGVPALIKVLAGKGTSLTRDTKRAAIADYGLNISAKPSPADIRSVKAILQAQNKFIRAEYTRRAERLVEIAQTTVTNGKAAGLSDEIVSGLLAKVLQEYQKAASTSYFDVLAIAVSNRIRTSIKLNAFSEGGVEYVKFVTMGDEKVCETCTRLNGKIAAVGDLIRIQQRTESLEDPEDIKDSQPWSYKNGPSGNIVYRRGGILRESPTDVAGIVAAGLFAPPLHGWCRCDLVPSAAP